MVRILNIETATKNCSVSVAENGELLAFKELNDGKYSHSEKLHLFILEVLQELKLSLSDIDAFAVSKGPGSYTGLRIGVSSVKGLCFACDKPLISVDTLQSLATAVNVSSGCIVPMLDARRMEVYSAVYNSGHNLVRNIKAEVIDVNSFSEELASGSVTFLGDGAEKCESVIKHPNANFIPNIFPSAKQMSSLSFAKYQKEDFEDVAYFEPFYLKDFLVTPEKKKI